MNQIKVDGNRDKPAYYPAMPDEWKSLSATDDIRLFDRYQGLLKESPEHFEKMESMILKVNVPTTGRSQYYTGMTTERLEQKELPPPKGIWALNTDRLLKVACQMEMQGRYTPDDENEQTQDEQYNIRIGPQGVVLDDNSNENIEVAISDLNIQEKADSDEDEQSLPESSVPDLEGDFKWDNQDVTSTIPPAFSETESLKTHDPLNFRKRSHFNGRPFASWGNLFPPLFASEIMPLAPITQKLWWQVTRDMVPADSNTTRTTA